MVFKVTISWHLIPFLSTVFSLVWSQQGSDGERQRHVASSTNQNSAIVGELNFVQIQQHAVSEYIQMHMALFNSKKTGLYVIDWRCYRLPVFFSPNVCLHPFSSPQPKQCLHVSPSVAATQSTHWPDDSCLLVGRFISFSLLARLISPGLHHRAGAESASEL